MINIVQILRCMILSLVVFNAFASDSSNQVEVGGVKISIDTPKGFSEKCKMNDFRINVASMFKGFADPLFCFVAITDENQFENIIAIFILEKSKDDNISLDDFNQMKSGQLQSIKDKYKYDQIKLQLKGMYEQEPGVKVQKIEIHDKGFAVENSSQFVTYSIHEINYTYQNSPGIIYKAVGKGYAFIDGKALLLSFSRFLRNDNDLDIVITGTKEALRSISAKGS